MEHIFQKAQPKLVALFGAVAIGFVLCFTLVLSASLQLASPTGMGGYDYFYLEGYTSTFEATQEGQKLVITGCAYVDGARIDTVNNVVVLYNEANGVYLALPTQMVQDETINADAEDGLDYSYAGLYASAYLWQLEDDLSDYRIFLSYRTNGENFLVRTDWTLEDML